MNLLIRSALTAIIAAASAAVLLPSAGPEPD